MDEQRVAVVLDPEYGARLAQIATAHPVWVVASVANYETVQTLRTQREVNITTFNVSDATQRVENLLNVLPDLDLHHPRLTSLLVVGLAASPTLEVRLNGEGFGNSIVTEVGFIAHRLLGDWRQKYPWRTA